MVEIKLLINMLTVKQYSVWFNIICYINNFDIYITVTCSFL